MCNLWPCSTVHRFGISLIVGNGHDSFAERVQRVRRMRVRNDWRKTATAADNNEEKRQPRGKVECACWTAAPIRSSSLSSFDSLGLEECFLDGFDYHSRIVAQERFWRHFRCVCVCVFLAGDSFFCRRLWTEDRQKEIWASSSSFQALRAVNNDLKEIISIQCQRDAWDAIASRFFSRSMSPITVESLQFTVVRHQNREKTRIAI